MLIHLFFCYENFQSEDTVVRKTLSMEYRNNSIHSVDIRILIEHLSCFGLHLKPERNQALCMLIVTRALRASNLGVSLTDQFYMASVGKIKGK